MYPSGLSILLSLCTFWQHYSRHTPVVDSISNARERGRKSRKSGELVNIPSPSLSTKATTLGKPCWAATGMQRRHADGLRSQSGLPDTPGHIRAALGLLLVFVAIDLICNGAGIAYIKESTIILVISG